ncbi:MAG: radical SAM protein [Desulfopila sp.]|jgi:radical SAM superfamily enzyme YgiQ (UPF0313 family)|nr:radical SAM protein [Desulfopila sp.]
MKMNNQVKGDVLLLQPWIEDFYATDCRSLPLGLAYLAGSIKKSLPGQSVYLYDFFSAHRRKTLPYPKEFQYLKRYYGTYEKSPSALFHNYYRFGVVEEAIVKNLQKHNPFLIGISSLFSPYYREALALAALCKRLFPDTPVVFGGNHASLSPETLLLRTNDDATSGFSGDFVIRGEGEKSIVDLIQALLGGGVPEAVAGVVSRDTLNSYAASSLHPLDRDETPFPDYCNLDLRQYTYKRKPMAFLLTSRSCPHHCDFCTIHAVFGRRYTVRSNDDIIAEICHFYNRGVRHFDIEDDNFSFQQKKCGDLLDRIVQLNLEDVGFSAMNGLSYHTLTFTLLEKMKAAGFTDLNLSLVCSQERLLEMSQRPKSGEHLENVLNNADVLGLHVVVYFIIGLPIQTLEDAVETLCYLAQKKCLIGPSPFYMTPKSALHRKYHGTDALQPASSGKDICFSARLSALDNEKPGFGRDELYTVFRLTRVINYLKRLIDQGVSPDAEPFVGAVRALARGEWETHIEHGTAPPFSPAVHRLLLGSFTGVQGSKTRTSYDFLLK